MYLVEGLLAVSEGYSTTIITGSVEAIGKHRAGTGAESVHLICRQEAVKACDTGPDMCFWNLKSHLVWHSYLNKATYPPTRPYLLLLHWWYMKWKVILKFPSLWAHLNSNVHRPGSWFLKKGSLKRILDGSEKQARFIFIFVCSMTRLIWHYNLQTDTK